MTRYALRTTTLLLGLLLAAPLALAAQQKKGAKGRKPPGSQKPAALVYEREVFTYPTQGRRNPFHPLVGEAETGPRFSQLRLEGIIYDDQHASQSVAILGTSTVTESADSTTASVSKGEAWYLKAGQTVGNVRIIQVDRDRVVVDVEEFGLTTRKIMQIQTGPGGGTS